ncbi:hypothetical protein BT93_H0696 [Corymbia citriodora subsp. variegata]|nr:hypothetical protein BT93_H0696 [Corymbia citriodora subsp. variegata]
MTGDVDVHREASAEVAPVNGKIDEKCGMEARAQQDLVKSVGDCNGVSRREEEEAVDNGIENGNGNGKDDADGSYVFVKGSEAVGEGVGNGFVGADLREKSVEGKASTIDVGGLKVSAENGNCDVEQAGLNRENGDGEGELVNGENGDCHSDDHIVVNEVELVEQEGNGALVKENNKETVVDEVETDAGHGKVFDLNDGECPVEDHLMDNGTGVEDLQGEFIESTLVGSTSDEEQNREADIVESTCSNQHEGEFPIEKQPAVEPSSEASDEFFGSCDATVVASKGDNTFQVPQADEAHSSGQMGRDVKSLEVEPSLEASEELSGSCDVIVVASDERTSEVPQADQADSSGQVDGDQKSELKIEDSGEGEVLKMDNAAGNEDEKVMEETPDIETEQNHESERTFEIPQADQADSSGQVEGDQKSELNIEDSGEVEVLKIDDAAGNEDEKVMEERKSCPDIETAQNLEPEKTSEVPQADLVDSSGQVDGDQKSEMKIEDCGEGEILEIDDRAGNKDEKAMEERKLCPDTETEQNHEAERTFEVQQADQADPSGQADEDQKSELTIVDSGEGEVLKIDDGAGNEDEKVMEERQSCPDIETEQNHEPERTFEVPQANQADSSGQVIEDQKSELTIVDSGGGEVGMIDDRVANKDEKVMEEGISCPDVDTEQNPEPEVILMKDFVSDKENSSTKISDDSSSEAAPEDISMKANTFATADTRTGPFSDDTGDVEPIATAPEPIASENVEHGAVTDTLDTSQEINEEAHTSENPESTPSSVSRGNVPVQIELEELNAEENQTGIHQCVDADLEVGEENESMVVDVTSSCSATNLSAITEICFGSIGQKEICSIPSDDINAESKVSNSLSQSAGSHHTHTTECPSNDAAENESFSAQDSKLGLKNELDAVLDEKREDQSAIEDDKPAFSLADGVVEVAQNDAAPAEVSSTPASEQQNVGSEVEKKLFNVLVKIPRHDDENSKQQINEAQLQVTEKTQSRDAIQAEIQIIKAACKEHSDRVEVALSEENAARESFKCKREKIECVQSVINKVKNAITVGDYDVRIQNMEQKIQHETLPLKEEKQLVRDIKQLKYSREQLTNIMGGVDELKLALDQREQTEEQLKSLRREADLLRENVLKAEAVTKSAKRKYSEERDRLRELQGQFRDADKIRQEAYIHLKNLRKQSYEKNKYFWKYKDDLKMSIDLASKGDREALSRFCIDQVETFMELWNRSNNFREEYLRCNAPRTLRRLGTADGRSLGPDEAMPAIPVNHTAVKDKSMSALPSLEQEKVPVIVEARPAADDKLPAKEVEQKKQKAKNKSSAKPVAQVEDLVTVSSRDVVNVEIEEPKLSKEEEELAKKAEELRKAEEAAMLMEQRRLEEKAKAKEALERKKRNAERALARAALKAQKEAEQKEKEREKKAKKKERKKAGGAVAMPSEAGIEGEPASSSEVTAEASADIDTKDKPAAMVKRPQKPLHFVKQTKVKPIPAPLRNRGKRKMQPWMWAVLTVVLVFALFLVSNGWNLF